MHRRFFLPLILFLAAGLLALGGCASTSAPSTDRADVLGVWKYRANGSQYLDRGTFKIVLADGRLQGVLRDARIGTASLSNVRLRNGQLQLRVEYFQRSRFGYDAQNSYLQVRGRVEDDEYTATFHQPLYDVTTPQRYRHQRHRSSVSGSIVARRVQAGGAANVPFDLGCTDALEESNYDCQE
jgi:hypothetical protein